MGETVDLSYLELVDVVDVDNMVLATTTRADVRRRNLLHRAVSVLCRNRDGEVYVHRRTTTKDISPGMYEMFVSGIVQSQESYDDAARRELGEELGVYGVEPHLLFRYLFRGPSAQCWIAVYEVEWDGPFVSQPDEIDWAEFVSWDRLLTIRSTWPFTPDNLAVFDRYLATIFPHQTRT